MLCHCMHDMVCATQYGIVHSIAVCVIVRAWLHLESLGTFWLPVTACPDMHNMVYGMVHGIVYDMVHGIVYDIMCA